mgnify:CR=1 FL=1
MAKNVHKKAKEKEEIYTLEISKKSFKRLLKLMLNNKAFDYLPNSLKDVLLEIENDSMKFTATDSNALVNAEIKLDNKYPKFKALLNGTYLSKVKIYKSWVKNCAVDTVKIVIGKEKLNIEDVINGITYSIPYVKAQYPEYEELFKIHSSKENIQYAVNLDLINRIKDIQTMPPYTYISISKNNLCPMIFENEENDEIKYRALVMPCQVRKLNNEEVNNND